MFDVTQLAGYTLTNLFFVKSKFLQSMNSSSQSFLVLLTYFKTVMIESIAYQSNALPSLSYLIVSVYCSPVIANENDNHQFSYNPKKRFVLMENKYVVNKTVVMPQPFTSETIETSGQIL